MTDAAWRHALPLCYALAGVVLGLLLWLFVRAMRGKWK